MTKRAVTYARVSYDDTGTDGRNLDSQQEMCRCHCQKRGHEIVKELREDDKGASGADFDLPKLTEMLEMARAKAFDVLVVREGDRLSRDQIKAAIIYRDLTKLGIAIEYVLYDFPPGPAGDMSRGMMALIAEYQRQDAIIKTARGRRNSVKSGNINVGNRPPYGYQVVEDKQGDKLLCRRLEPYEPEARIVRLVFDWYTHSANGNGPLSLGGITLRLRELAIPTPSAHNPHKGGRRKMGVCDWNRDTVRRILKSETYAGRWYYGKQGHRAGGPRLNPREHWLEVAVPAIVDDTTWQAVSAQFTANRRNAWRPTGEQYLLRHMLTCGKCGSAMQCECSVTRGGAGRYHYYTCCARRGKLTYAKRCDGPNFRGDWVDAEVWKWIKGLLSEPEKLEKALAEIEQEGERKAAPTRRRLGTLTELIGENTAELERVKAMCQRGLYTLDEAAGKTAQIDDTLGRLNKERVKLETSIAGQVRSSEQVRGVLAFAKDQAGNVERATRRFDVRRGLMEDLEVTATLPIAADGVPEVQAACVVGKKTLRDETTTTSSRPPRKSQAAPSRVQ